MIQLTTYLLSDRLGEYNDKLLELYTSDSALNRTIPESIRPQTESLLRMVNCYYSNRIEGNPTRPKDLLKSLSEDTPASEREPDVALMELLAHLEVQLKASHTDPSRSTVCSETFIRNLHNSFYNGLPKEHLKIKNLSGETVLTAVGEPLLIVPGDYRTKDVKVGEHIPPSPSELAGYMAWLAKSFDASIIHGTNRVLAAAALHHRLAWIHPFQDGNGRVVRLLTDCYMRCSGFGGYGLWSITRGFGKDTQKYYSALKQADKPRQGDFDGRGILSDSGLLNFTKYFIDTSLDQVKYFSELLDPKALSHRIDFYFDSRAKDSLPGNLPVLKITARDVYKLLLDKGKMSRKSIGTHLGIGEQTLRPIFKQMDSEGLIKAKPKQDIEIRLSTHIIEYMFPALW